MTTTALTARRPQGAGIGWPKLLARTLGAEWVKLRSVRSTYGSLLAAVVVTAGIAALAGWAMSPTTSRTRPRPPTWPRSAPPWASSGSSPWPRW